MQNKIIAALPPAEVRGDEYHVDCPFCGKEAKPRQNHFSYNPVKFACHCQVCKGGGSLYDLAHRLNLPEDKHSYQPRRRRPAPRKERKTFSDKLLASYEASPLRHKEWFDYRGLRPTTVDRFRLGYGKLPGEAFMYSTHGLILPVFNRAGVCRTLRGRMAGGWMTAGDKRLYAPVGVKAGATVIVVENCANACLAWQAAPWLSPIAMTTGAASWSEAWVNRIAELTPKLVIVAGDADDAGRKMNARWSEALAARGVLTDTLELTEEIEEQWRMK